MNITKYIFNFSKIIYNHVDKYVAIKLLNIKGIFYFCVYENKKIGTPPSLNHNKISLDFTINT